MEEWGPTFMWSFFISDYAMSYVAMNLMCIIKERMTREVYLCNQGDEYLNSTP